MDTKHYATAFRAALAVTRERESDIRDAKDEANAIGSCVAMIKAGTLAKTDLKRPDDPAVKAALKSLAL